MNLFLSQDGKGSNAKYDKEHLIFVEPVLCPLLKLPFITLHLMVLTYQCSCLLKLHFPGRIQNTKGANFSSWDCRSLKVEPN